MNDGNGAFKEMLHKRTGSFGTKLFKSLTATADETGNKFQIPFSNFSDAITVLSLRSSKCFTMVSRPGLVYGSTPVANCF
uniref:Uncharacterized protein n=2 Tax=Parascaris univalens TaxID=6257 RepID=A0A915B0S5_PARUN